MNDAVRVLVKAHLGRLGANINRQINKISEMQNEMDHERRILRLAQDEYAMFETALEEKWFDPKKPIHDFVYEEDLDERSN